MLILIVVLETFLAPDVYSRNTSPLHELIEVDSTRVHSAIDTSQIVSDYFFFAFGWGNPQGARFDFGQDVGTTMIVGATLSFNDQWSSNRSAGRVGIILGPRITTSDTNAIPFVLASAGESYEFFSKSEYYAFVHFGFKVPTKSQIQIRPEAGLDTTFKINSSGSRKEQLWFGFNISMVIELH